MKTYNFKRRFASDLIHDLKLTTIRRRGKIAPPVPGEFIRRYTGMRTKQCECLGDRICASVRRFQIDKRGQVRVNGLKLVNWEVTYLAIGDGFASVQEFLDFFRIQYRLPFTGWLIRWRARSKSSTPQHLHD